MNSKICSKGQICGYVMSIHVYPVKSCAGNSVSQRKIDRFGFVGDRRLMVVRATPDSNGAHAFVTQRQIAAMARIVCSELEADLLLSFPDRPPLRVPQSVPNARRIRVRVWEENLLYAADLGDEPAAWISNVLGTSCRLVSASMGSWSRKLSAEYVPWHLRWFIGAPQVGFADGYPFLLTSEASLSELNSRIGGRPQASSELPMSRFRPNIVVSGCKAFAEDTWRRIRIGELEFYSVKGCSRCKITTTDQETGEVGGLLGVDGVTAEPLATLSSFRKFNDNVYFGQNLVHAWPIPFWRRLRLYIQGKTQQPSIRVGDLVQVLEWAEPTWDKAKTAAE
ncbi:hypothetical protein AB1Y20_003764 [Prymnesium parvum]|uniref:MOSC domain-containing protein n=1 Tax=Prymnesium parvum TaxID=97485 RepID=A0AB34J656_PRYPA